MYCTRSNSNFTFCPLSTIKFKLALHAHCFVPSWRVWHHRSACLPWIVSGCFVLKKDSLKPVFFWSQHWKSVLNLILNPSKCDVTPQQRSLSTHHLVRAAVGSIYREDLLRNPWISGSTLLPPIGKGWALCYCDQRLLLMWYGINLICIHLLSLCILSINILCNIVMWMHTVLPKMTKVLFGRSVVISSLNIAGGTILCILLCHASLEHMRHSNQSITRVTHCLPCPLWAIH